MIKLPIQVENIICELEKAGFEAFAVGGCIRDMLMGISPADYDVASCLYTQIPESRINTELFNHHQKTEYPYNHTENAF